MSRNQTAPVAADFEGMKRTAAKYVFAAKFTTGKACLDIACGSGYGSAYLATKGSPLVVGGDISPNNVRDARAAYLQPGTDFFLLDAHELPFKADSFDAVISIETIEHLGKPADFLKECHRILKRDGVLILSTPNKKMASPYAFEPAERNKGFQSHVKEFEPEELAILAKTYFQKWSATDSFM